MILPESVGDAHYGRHGDIGFSSLLVPSVGAKYTHAFRLRMEEIDVLKLEVLRRSPNISAVEKCFRSFSANLLFRTIILALDSSHLLGRPSLSPGFGPCYWPLLFLVANSCDFRRYIA